MSVRFKVAGRRLSIPLLATILFLSLVKKSRDGSQRRHVRHHMHWEFRILVRMEPHLADGAHSMACECKCVHGAWHVQSSDGWARSQRVLPARKRERKTSDVHIHVQPGVHYAVSYARGACYTRRSTALGAMAAAESDCQNLLIALPALIAYTGVTCSD